MKYIQIENTLIHSGRSPTDWSLVLMETCCVLMGQVVIRVLNVKTLYINSANFWARPFIRMFVTRIVWDFWLVPFACLRSHWLFWVSYLLYCFPEMDAGPFSRRQWATQSLRITAKELSLVGGRGKNNAITERFSKWVLFPLFQHGSGEYLKKKVVFICGDYLDERNVTCKHHNFLLVTELIFDNNQKVNGRILLTFYWGYSFIA